MGARGSGGRGVLWGVPDLQVGTRERVIVWLLVGVDVCCELTGAGAGGGGGREGTNCGPGQMVAALQGLAAERGARFWSCAGG